MSEAPDATLNSEWKDVYEYMIAGTGCVNMNLVNKYLVHVLVEQ